ncbi:MAG: hypothetical protein OXJ90_03560 [Spirochaetaceae bacterium]|nr:hypothetical protein [Spirochaetaceae bacterium]
MKFGETGLRLTYAPDAPDTTKRLQDANANEAAGFSNRWVRNETPDPNNAPRVLDQQTAVGGNTCKVKTDADAWGMVVNAELLASNRPLTTRTSTDTAEFPESCTRTSNAVAPMFRRPGRRQVDRHDELHDPGQRVRSRRAAFRRSRARPTT